MLHPNLFAEGPVQRRCPASCSLLLSLLLPLRELPVLSSPFSTIILRIKALQLGGGGWRWPAPSTLPGIPGSDMEETGAAYLYRLIAVGTTLHTHTCTHTY